MAKLSPGALSDPGIAEMRMADASGSSRGLAPLRARDSLSLKTLVSFPLPVP